MERKKGTSGKLVCESQSIKNFSKGDTILRIEAGGDSVGMIMEGSAHVSCTDDEGRSSILEFLEARDGFGAPLLCPTGSQEYAVIADTDCTVMMIGYTNVLYNCRSNCKNHAELVKTLLLLLEGKVQSLSLHIGILSQRTLRDKVLTYLQSLKARSGSDAFRIPMTLTRLADYLGVDRSAMMREIHNMNIDGIIRSKGRDFVLAEE